MVQHFCNDFISIAHTPDQKPLLPALQMRHSKHVKKALDKRLFTSNSSYVVLPLDIIDLQMI
tara:strand:+ start:549 stop:734 length:186 start_codon:yes stop_codon:yes gene_type:complete